MSLAKERRSNAQFTTELFQYSEQSWAQVKDNILRIEKACFGNLGYTEKDFVDDFEKPSSVIIVLRNPDGKIVGYTYTNTKPRGTATANIESTAIDPDYQKRGLVGNLMRTLEDELRRRAFEYLTRDAAIANGYADSIQRHYGRRIIESRDHPSKYGPQRFFRIRL